MSIAVDERRTVECFGNQLMEVPDDIRMLDEWEELQEGDCVFRILSPTAGDERLVWNQHSIPEINAAKQTFNELLARGMVPYKVGTDGRPSAKVMDSFDPHEGEVVFTEVVFVPRPALTKG